MDNTTTLAAVIIIIILASIIVFIIEGALKNIDLEPICHLCGQRVRIDDDFNFVNEKRVHQECFLLYNYNKMKNRSK